MGDMRETETERALLKEAIRYFKAETSGYHKLFQALRSKYESYGEFGDKIRLTNLSNEEADRLSGLLRKRYDPGKSAQIKLADLENGLKETRFGELSLLRLVEAYYREPLRSKKEKKQQEQLIWQQFWIEVTVELKGLFTREPDEKSPFLPVCMRSQFFDWLQDLTEQQATGSVAVRQWYSSAPEELRKSLRMVAQAFCILDALGKSEYVRLPVLAAKTTGNPHAFDSNQALGKLLLYALAHAKKQDAPQHAEEIAQLLYEHRVLRDDLSSHVMVCGITYVDADEQHSGNHWPKHEVIGLPLRTVVNKPVWYPVMRPVHTDVRVVWVMENPAVFSAIVDRWEQQMSDHPYPPLVCSSGQFTLAVWALLDRLVQGGCQLFYSGDFDPEGFQMAARVWRRYGGEAVKLWRYTTSDYQQAMTTQYEIDEARWDSFAQSILQNKWADTPDWFQEMVQAVVTKRKPGYQESIIDELFADLISMY